MAHRKREGVIALPHSMLQHEKYLGLSAQAKVLMLLLQSHWSVQHPARPIGFGVREAERNIPCSRRTAMAAFDELQEKGFIEKVEESKFCSRAQSKTRTWRISWASCKGYSATHRWKQEK